MKSNNAPFVMHLERVCRLMDMGQRFTIEFNPSIDVCIDSDYMLRNVELRIRAGGDVTLVLHGGISITAYGLSLANYRRLWRCWQGRVPTKEQRQAMRWG